MLREQILTGMRQVPGVDALAHEASRRNTACLTSDEMNGQLQWTTDLTDGNCCFILAIFSKHRTA